MPDVNERNPVEALAEEFLARYREGERPPLSEYVGRYPELAAEIRDLFPALVMMEEVVPSGPTTDGGRPPGSPTSSPLTRLGQVEVPYQEPFEIPNKLVDISAPRSLEPDLSVLVSDL